MSVIFVAKKRIQGWLFLGLCGILCFCLAFLPLFKVQATSKNTSPSIGTLRQQQQQVDKERQGILQKRDRLTNLQTEAEQRLNGLEQNLQTTNAQIQDSEMRLELASTTLQQLEAQLAEAERSYQEHQAATVGRLRFLQRTPASQGWAVLLQSRDINDFLSRRRHLKLVYLADRNMLATLTAKAAEINQQRTEVEGQKNQINLIRQQLLAQKADFQTQANLQAELIQRLNSDRNALEAAQAQLERDSEALGNLIQQKLAEARAREEREKARIRDRAIISGSGLFAVPSDGYTSSPFGWRVHPVLGYRRFHSGLDFAAGYGSTIRAAESGEVILAGWYGGYGKTVIINHGKGITTLYAHSSELYVSEGQSVKRGQPVAAVGSTGLSTGPHLHFEVRRDGTPINPADFL